MSKIKWTKKKPTEEGFYWIKSSGNGVCGIAIAHVIAVDDNPFDEDDPEYDEYYSDGIELIANTTYLESAPVDSKEYKNFYWSVTQIEQPEI